MTITLDNADKAILRGCPEVFREDRNRKPTAAAAARAARIKRLWVARLIRAEVISEMEWKIHLTEAGRAALGLPPTRPEDVFC